MGGNLFNKIKFGYTSAQTEGAEAPELLKKGYVDHQEIHDKIYNSSKYLVLGYKGAGKSAVGEKLKVDADGSYDTFISVVALGDFPFKPFSKIIRGDIDQSAKMPIAWSWVILPYVLGSLAKDNGISHINIEAFNAAVATFEKMGLTSRADPARIVTTSAKNSFSIPIPLMAGSGNITWSSSQMRPASEIPDYVESLKDLLSDVRTDSRHFIVIDGLDDAVSGGKFQFETLGTLITEVDKINTFFRANEVPIKIILLCRTDIFEHAEGANKNKIRQDRAVELTWHKDDVTNQESPLLVAANLRANISNECGDDIDIFSEFFPSHVNRTPIRQFLLDHTRHTPRDFFQLLTKIQDFAPDDKISEEQVRKGVNSYSLSYFYPEIKDELSGYIERSKSIQFFETLGQVRKRDIKLNDLVSDFASTQIDRNDLIEILRILFECSAIGNIIHSNGATRYTFKYRNRHSSFNPQEGIMLHRGLWKALNVP